MTILQSYEKLVLKGFSAPPRFISKLRGVQGTLAELTISEVHSEKTLQNILNKTTANGGYCSGNTVHTCGLIAVSLMGREGC